MSKRTRIPTPEPRKQYTKRWREKQRADGLVQVTVTVPVELREQLLAWAEAAREAAFEPTD